MKTLRIALLEYDIVWENPAKNFEKIDELLKDVKADIFLLPEMFSTGFTMNPEKNAEPIFGKSFKYLQQKAIDHRAAFCASVPTKSDGQYFNRLYWVEPNETFVIYDKRHLFSLVGEEKHYTAGLERKVIDYKGWRLMPQICYDLRFPVWARNDLNYDVIFYLANWPERRKIAWLSLLQARSIENMSYCIGVNRIGDDAQNIYHSGDSNVFDAQGNKLESLSESKEVLIYELKKKDLLATREKFKFLNDKDDFKINL